MNSGREGFWFIIGWMKFNIIAIGKLKESYWIDGVREYEKRLAPYVSCKIAELPDEKVRATLPVQKLQKLEEVKILKEAFSEGSYNIVLDVKGEQVTSEQLAKKIEKIMQKGSSQVNWIIGGATGLSEGVIKKADWTLSLSHLTFPHQMARLVLMEQIYRAFRIIKNEPYHK